MRISQWMRKFAVGQSGATAIEYGLIAALIAVIVIASVTATGEETKQPFETLGTAIAEGNARGPNN